MREGIQRRTNKEITILEPDILNFYVKSGGSKLVTAKGLRVYKDADVESDIRVGASVFNEVSDYIKKDYDSRYIMIDTDSLEFGYMAISYLHSAYLNRDNLDENYAYYAEYDEGNLIDEWQEYSDLIPIINGSEANSILADEYNNYGVGNYSNMNQLFGECTDSKPPFWLDCCNEAVCLLYFDSRMCLNEDLKNVLEYFNHNKRVYIILVHDMKGMVFGEDELFSNPFTSNTKSLWDYAILDYSVEEISVIKQGKDLSTYYKNIFKCVLKRKGLNVKRGFSYDTVIQLLISMKNEDKCEMIRKVINYAIRHRDYCDKTPLTNQDFEFLKVFAKRQFVALPDEKEEHKSLRAMEEELVGMESVKQQVKNIVQVMKFNQMRQRMNINGGTFHNVHMMLGAPGTAKTTIAKFMGKMMMEEQLLPGERFICVNGAELKGMYVGHSAPKTKQIFEANDIIVIDEAYSLVDSNGQNDSFAQEAIAQMITEMEEHSVDKLIIFAGYGGKKVDEKDNRMRDFLNANPGIKSRINSTIYFDSYTPEQMADIFYTIAKVQTYTVPGEARKDIVKYFETRVLADNFGNGREARSLLEMSTLYTAKRIMQKDKSKITKADLQTIVLEDIKNAIKDAKNQLDVRDCTYDTKKVGF